jgi:hypothetical protein
MTIRVILAMLALVAVANVAAAQPPRPDQPRTVSMTLAEYNRLLALAARAPVAPVAAPVAAVAAAANLQITVDRETARGAFTVTGQVLHNGVARVPLLANAAVLNASADGRPVPLVVDGQHLQALLPPGPFTVNLDWATPIVFRPGRASFTLPVPQAGAARVTIEVPGERTDVRVTPGLITRRSPGIGRTIVEATLDPGSSTDVSWSVRDSAATPTKDVRALADVFTLITLNDADIRMAALIDVTVIQGELRSLAARLPAGYELTAVTGSSLEESVERNGEVVLTIANPSARSHQFLINLERPHTGGSLQLDTGIVVVGDLQRERGEIGIEGVGTLDLSAADRPGLQRIDVRELNPSLHALTRLPILAAFRYQRPSGAAAPQLALDIRRFDDAGVLAAVADRAIATTMITSEGRALTEIRLEMRNRSQPFLKVELPPGASIVSVDVAGQSAKPAAGPDGTRVPLMRAGLRTTAMYPVSFVYMHAGTPFQKKGDIQMTLPKMDVPIGVVEWELFVPEQYSARAIDGNVIDSRRFNQASHRGSGFGLTGAPKEPVAMAETVTVEGETVLAQRSLDELKKQVAAPPSQNVVNLQARAAGVLPIRVDVPQAGVSHQFIKPLVINAEPVVKFRYKRR